MFDSLKFDGVKGIEIEAFKTMRLHGNGFNPCEIEGIGYLKWWIPLLWVILISSNSM
jgi:hypothetical protein